MKGSELMQELINDAFKSLNLFKRHRTLHSEAKHKGNHVEAQIQELKMYQTFDSLELIVRGIQRNEREKWYKKEVKETQKEDEKTKVLTKQELVVGNK